MSLSIPVVDADVDRRRSRVGRHDVVGDLAVAVSGCASTVGVRALSAATHVDDVNWCLGVKGLVVVGEID